MHTSTGRTLSDSLLVVALCPLIAASYTIVSALSLGVATVLVAMTTAGIIAPLKRWLDDDTRLIAILLVTASIVAIVELAMRAWFHVARESVSIFLPLVATNLALAHRMHENPLPSRELFASTLRLTTTMALALAILGTAREIVGRGSILHNAQALVGSMAGEITLFRVDMGFLLAMLPPGAFIAFGCLLAVRNWLASTARREQD